MGDTLQFLVNHGYVVLFASVLAQLACSAALMADFVWFEIDRHVRTARLLVQRSIGRCRRLRVPFRWAAVRAFRRWPAGLRRLEVRAATEIPALAESGADHAGRLVSALIH